MDTILNTTPTWLVMLTLFICLLAAVWVGRKAGVRYSIKHGALPEHSKSLISAVLGLAAFLLAFSFSMSGTRYENRRVAIVEEANAIGTAILRADIYPDSIRNRFRNQFSEYLEARISFFTAGADLKKAYQAIADGEKKGAALWATAADYAKFKPEPVPSGLMIPSLNDMLDAATTRHYALIAKVPEIIVYMLFIVSIISAFFAGYSGRKERINRSVSVMFCLVTILVIYITLDLDRPRRGFIQYNETHKAIEDLRGLLR